MSNLTFALFDMTATLHASKQATRHGLSFSKGAVS